MKVILIENVKGTGKKDEIKEVKDGFGNFLIKNKKAVLYSSKSNEVLTKELTDRKIKEDEHLEECKKLKASLEKLNITFNVKTGEYGKVFGSISSKQICEELKKVGYEIDKKIINASNINTLGTHIVEINLHKNVTAELKVSLKAGD